MYAYCVVRVCDDGGGGGGGDGGGRTDGNRKRGPGGHAKIKITIGKKNEQT